ncbi:MAG: LacI family transcriptional regulator [Spirochaetes bacterium]|nr:LacI family transcriptional regulator [Spirochaetota bacterium]
MKVTIKDVAELAKVSQSTVSRVLHDNPKISERTKQKVKTAMKELGYVDNSPLYHFAKRTTRTIALLLRDQPKEFANNPFFIRLMQGASQYARQHYYHIMYAFYQDNEDELNYINDYVKSNLAKGIILVLSLKDDVAIDYMKSQNYPFVVVGRPPNLNDTFWVDNDNFQAIYDCVNRLITKGKRKIAYITTPLYYTALQYRLDGYKQALKNWDITEDNEMICIAPDGSEESGYLIMQELLKKKEPDAVVAIDDPLAFGALKAIQDIGLSNISIVGFNNSSRGLYQTPSLSSVDINPNELGRQAAKLLISQIEGQEIGIRHYIVETKLIERDTSLKPEYI